MTTKQMSPRLGIDMLNRLPANVRLPAYDRAALRAGMAHIGVGAFHRSHQAEYTDDLLEKEFDRWGVVGINIREPRLADTLGPQDGLYTRLIRDSGRMEARIIGSIFEVIDSQDSPAPALDVLASSDIDVVTLTVTEKGYCHRPVDGTLDIGLPDVAHDLANPETPRTLPGLILRALEMRMSTHGRPLTVMSCDNIPHNGALLATVVGGLAQRRGDKVADWIGANAAFPSTMVDRIAPATSDADLKTVEDEFGYRDLAAAVGEPFRQWVIEEKFAGRFPRWDRVGATFVDDVTPYEHIKMRVLNAAQSTLAYLGVLSGKEHTFDAIGEPVLEAFVRRMLVEESASTLPLLAAMPSGPYVEQSLARLHNTAIRHRCHQIATDGSQKIVQRLLNPIRERLARGQNSPLLALPVAAWMAYLLRASDRFGRAWTVDDPYAQRLAAIADRVGNDAEQLCTEIMAIEAIFHRELSANTAFRDGVAGNLDVLLAGDTVAHVKQICQKSGPTS